MNRRSILIFIAGLIIIGGSYFLSFYMLDMEQEDNTKPTKEISFDFSTFNFDYNNVFNQIGGGEFKNEDVEIYFNKDWILNKTSPKDSGLIKNTGNILFNAYAIEEDTAVPWVFSITKHDSFDTLEYIQELEKNKVEIPEILEDGSFVMEFDNGTSKKTTIIQKIIKDNNEKVVTISLVTVNAPIEKVKETFNNLIESALFLNYKETIFLLGSGKNNNEEEEEEEEEEEAL